MKNIIIDCDPGFDDAISILTALGNKDIFNILGITTVYGNQPLDIVTKNTKDLLSFANSNIPICSGQSSPLVKKQRKFSKTQIKNLISSENISKENYPVNSTNEILFTFKKIMETKGKTTIVAIGPLTNIALLLKVFPIVKEKIDMISIMGGGIKGGNITSLAEFNFFTDPEAAKIVFNSNIPIVMSGLDVTNKAYITIDEVNSLENKGKFSNLVFDLLKSNKEYKIRPIHDLSAVVYLIEPNIFKGNYYNVDIITTAGESNGQSFINRNIETKKDRNTLVLYNVNREEFIKILFDSLDKLDNIK